MGSIGQNSPRFYNPAPFPAPRSPGATAVKFIIDNWLLIAMAASSGGLLLWQTLQKSGGGVGTAEAVRLINR